MAPRGDRFRDRWKRDEPQGRQRDETSPRSERGASRRGGAKPRGRNAGGCGNPLRRARERPGVDSLADVDGGAIFGQPQERKPGTSVPGREDREVPGKTARRSGGSRTPPCKWRRADRSKVPRGPGCESVPRPWRAVAKASRAMTSIGSSPRGRHPVSRAAGRGPCGGASPATDGARPCGVETGCFGSSGCVPRGVREEAAPQGEADPGDPVNPYPSVARDRPVAARPQRRRSATTRDDAPRQRWRRGLLLSASAD
jgi:hypothetical protein